MYRITSKNTFAGYADSVVPIRYHPDGFYIICEEAEAEGFCAKMAVTLTDEDGNWNIYSVNGIVVRKDYVAQETTMGTADNPIVWNDGATAYPNFYYTKDGVRKVWTGTDWAMPSWDDERFVEF